MLRGDLQENALNADATMQAAMNNFHAFSDTAAETLSVSFAGLAVRAQDERTFKLLRHIVSVPSRGPSHPVSTVSVAQGLAVVACANRNFERSLKN